MNSARNRFLFLFLAECCLGLPSKMLLTGETGDVENSAARHNSPITYVQYTDHGNLPGVSVHYVGGTATPVARPLPETLARPYVNPVIVYATALQKAAPPYANSPTVDYGTIQAHIVTLPKTTPLTLYYDARKMEKLQKTRNNDQHSKEGKEEEEKNKQSTFETSEGSEYSTEERSTTGKKGDSNYNEHHEFNKDEHSSYDDNGEKGSYDAKGGRKDGHRDTAGSYSKEEEEEKGGSGSKHEESSYHKKGGKTTGFHKVYHKDEYKKNTDFYDVSHKGGNFSKCSSFSGHHNKEEGNSKSGNNHNSAFENREDEKTNHYDAGHMDRSDRGHVNEQGEDSYHQNYSSYGSEGGSKSTGKYAYDKE